MFQLNVYEPLQKLRIWEKECFYPLFPTKPGLGLTSAGIQKSTQVSHTWQEAKHSSHHLPSPRFYDSRKTRLRNTNRDFNPAFWYRYQAPQLMSWPLQQMLPRNLWKYSDILFSQLSLNKRGNIIALLNAFYLEILIKPRLHRFQT